MDQQILQDLELKQEELFQNEETHESNLNDFPEACHKACPAAQSPKRGIPLTELRGGGLDSLDAHINDNINEVVLNAVPKKRKTREKIPKKEIQKKEQEYNKVDEEATESENGLKTKKAKEEM
eukprot:GHVR01105529.1.p2 GENE.GHVR01105529.1~~GHVR01105529.1.p2  ORF type:complete len:123 (+),score=26.66 GHVR01105529.1:1328-1696(+)